MFVALKVNKNQNGFSLISVIMAAGVLGIISIAVSQLIISQSQSVSYLEDRLAKIDYKNNLISLLSNSDACFNTFQTLPIAATQTINSIYNANNVETYNSTNKNVYERLILSSFDLKNIDIPATPGSSGRMKLVVNIERQRSGGGSKILSPVEVSLSVTTDASSGGILSCSALGGGSSNLDSYDDSKDCSDAPAAPMNPLMSQNLPAKNSNGKYEEGTPVNYPCPDQGGVLQYICINGTWSKIGNNRCFGRR